MNYTYFLNYANVGQKVVVKSLALPHCFSERLSVLGFKEGNVLCILSTAPFCGLLQIATPFGVFCLRREVACKIEVANV